MKGETESSIQSAICDYLALREHCFWRTNNIPAPQCDGGFRKLPKYTPRGLPDIIVIKDGRFVGLEVKKKGSYQTPDQKEFELQIKEAGGEYYVVRSIENVQEAGL
jgi:hypothetical protein